MPELHNFVHNGDYKCLTCGYKYKNPIYHCGICGIKGHYALYSCDMCGVMHHCACGSVVKIKGKEMMLCDTCLKEK